MKDGERQLYSKHRKLAVHWLDRSKSPPEIACGTAIPYVPDKANYTTDREAVTCKDCNKIASIRSPQ